MKNSSNQPNDEKQECCSEETFGSFYEICVKGQLDSSWSDWLEGMQVKLLDNEKMLLCGNMVDQAALLGLLNKLCGLNLSVLSLRQVKAEEKRTKTRKKEK